MSVSEITSNRRAQILRPLYQLLDDQPELIEFLQSQYRLPPLERINEDSELLTSGQLLGILRELALGRGMADIGLRIGYQLPVGCYGSLSFLMISSANFREMLENFCHYSSVLAADLPKPRLSVMGNELHLEMYSSPGINSSAADLVQMRNDLTIATARTLIHHAASVFKPSRVDIMGDGGAYIESYRQYLCCDNIYFNAEQMRLYAPKELLEQQLPGANSSLCKVFRKELDIALRALEAEHTIIDNIQRVLARSDNLGRVSLGSVAEALRMGERTLSRQLAEFDISFRDLLSNYKSSRAIRLLSEGKTVDEVAYYLGFSERAAFDRAFKKWQGVTASRFQQEFTRTGVTEVDVLDSSQLPNLPLIAHQLLLMIGDDDCDMDALVECVERDPSLTAKLLSLANSAMYGVVEISSVKHAIVQIFGVDTLRNLALGMLANKCFDTHHCKAFSLQRYWVHAFATAQLASELASAGGRVDASQAYLFGLLHNLGTLVLVQRRPEEMAGVIGLLDYAQDSLAVRCETEQALLGVNSCSAGAVLASFWHLPRFLGVAIRALQTSSYQGELADLVNLIAAVEAAVRTWSTGGELDNQHQRILAEAAGMDFDRTVDVLVEFGLNFEKIEDVAKQLL